MSTSILYPNNPALQTVDQYRCTRVPIASPTSRVGEVLSELMGQDYKSVTDIAVCNEGKLAGLIGIEKLLAASEEKSAGELMDTDSSIVAQELDQEKAAWNLVQRGESSLVVVDTSGHFLARKPWSAIETAKDGCGQRFLFPQSQTRRGPGSLSLLVLL